MGKILKPGQRCTNSEGVCGPKVAHYYHKPFDKLAISDHSGGRCSYVQPAIVQQPAGGATRPEVYAAIDTERAYQDGLWPDSGVLTIGEFVLMLSEYVDRAKSEWTLEKKPEQKTLKMVRKIAGIAVRCMEQHGAPPR